MRLVGNAGRPGEGLFVVRDVAELERKRGFRAKDHALMRRARNVNCSHIANTATSSSHGVGIDDNLVGWNSECVSNSVMVSEEGDIPPKAWERSKF
jgi:hypothetical protein